MKKNINPIKYIHRLIFASLFFVMILPLISSAQDFETAKNENLSISTNILFVGANVNFDQMSISYHGLSSGGGHLFSSGKNSYGLESSKIYETDSLDPSEDAYLLRFSRKLKQIGNHFIRYFNVDDFSIDDDADSKLLIKSKVNMDQMNYDQVNHGQTNASDFEFNLSLNIGYDDDTILKMSAVKLESHWMHTYVNAIYHYEKNEFELGLSTSYINNYLLNGMKLEFQANPVAGSGAILLTMSL